MWITWGQKRTPVIKTGKRFSWLIHILSSLSTCPCLEENYPFNNLKQDYSREMLTLSRTHPQYRARSKRKIMYHFEVNHSYSQLLQKSSLVIFYITFYFNNINTSVTRPKSNPVLTSALSPAKKHTT